jgi:hypothetical protein
MTNSINPYHRISGIVDDHSNTPIVSDGISYRVRGFPSNAQTGFVIFIDVLGVKGIWKRMESNTVFNKWRAIVSRFVDSISNSPLKRLNPYFTTLSDTIIIACECSIEFIDIIFNALVKPFIYSIQSEFFLRGAISHGTYYLSTILTIGKAIDEAASAHNKIDMIGIFTSPELSASLKTNGLLKDTNNAIRYPYIRTKNGSYEGLALNWYMNDDPKSLEILIKELNTQTDDSIKRKYRNTISFCQYGA